MRILIDTNVLISAALNPAGTPAKAYEKAASYPNHGLICEQNIEELTRIFNRKFPDKLPALEKFLSTALVSLELVPIPADSLEYESMIRDTDDRPILRAAKNAHADILITGDRDFLESGIDSPAIMTPAEFVDL